MSRTAAARQFVMSAAWMFVAFEIAGFCAHFVAPAYVSLTAGLLTLLLLLAGFWFLGITFDGVKKPVEAMGWVKRPTRWKEFGLGLAISWGMSLVVVLPMVAGRAVHPEFRFDAAAWNTFVLGVLSLLVVAAAEETAFRGYPFQRLAEAAGPAWATVLLATVFGLVQIRGAYAGVASSLTIMLFSILCAVAYLRTRGLWLPLGLNFGWVVTMRLLFGLPSHGSAEFASVVSMQTNGRSWLTGGLEGPEASVFAPIILLVGIAVMVKTTRDYAWEFTFDPIEGAGYAMDAPVPPEHAAMEAAAKPAPLVQILSTTSSSPTKRD